MPFWKKLPPVQIKVLPVHPVNLSLDQWRSQSALVTKAKELSDNETVKAMVEVLKNEHPGTKGMPFGTAMNDRLVQQARAEGYQQCLNNLRLLSTFKTLVQSIEATFEPPEKE